MGEFTRQWLQLRESADHRARCGFEQQLQSLHAARWHVIDLGCGAGSNLRFLSAKLRGMQDWICIDHDANLLEGIAQPASPGPVESVRTVRADLTADIDALLAAASADAAANACTLVTASALLDLVSSAWVDALSAACARMQAPVLFALTYDGRIQLSPRHSEDEQLRALVNEHQGNDKGFGPALGPGATQYARAAFERLGYRVAVAASDWRLDSRDIGLQRELLAGWIAAARAQSGERQLLRDWHEHRAARIDARSLDVRVGHRDLLALPPQSEVIA